MDDDSDRDYNDWGFGDLRNYGNYDFGSEDDDYFDEDYDDSDYSDEDFGDESEAGNNLHGNDDYGSISDDFSDDLGSIPDDSSEGNDDHRPNRPQKDNSPNWDHNYGITSQFFVKFLCYIRAQFFKI